MILLNYPVAYSGDARWNVANSEWGQPWMVISNLLPNTEYEVKVIAKNKFGDTASSTLYRVHTQPRSGRSRSLENWGQMSCVGE